GASPARAISCFAFGQRVAFADTNIQRVLGRYFLGRRGTNKEAVELDARAMPKRNADLWHHALMDLGATICLPRAPRCPECPLRADCVTARLPAVGGRPPSMTARATRPAAYPDTDRRVRGAIVRALVKSDAGMTVRAL